MNKFLKIIYYGLIGLVAALLLMTSIPTGPLKIFVVQSGSMEPAIQTGSVILVKSSSEYRVGDAITFGSLSSAKPPTTHRIVEVNDDNGKISYVTKGDANNGPDFQPVSKKDVIGKVILDISYIGYLVVASKTPIGFLVILGIPAGIIIFDELKKIISIKKSEDE